MIIVLLGTILLFPMLISEFLLFPSKRIKGAFDNGVFIECVIDVKSISYLGIITSVTFC